jgi:AmiR/NasT family two-component response regulator
LAEIEMELARALADVATVGILQQRVISARDLLAEQLQGALNSRVLIEQAEGVLAERSGPSVDAAFVLIRSHARTTGAPLTAVATDIIARRTRL